jgi:hypothetical protein
MAQKSELHKDLNYFKYLISNSSLDVGINQVSYVTGALHFPAKQWFSLQPQIGAACDI